MNNLFTDGTATAFTLRHTLNVQAAQKFFEAVGYAARIVQIHPGMFRQNILFVSTDETLSFDQFPKRLQHGNVEGDFRFLPLPGNPAVLDFAPLKQADIALAHAGVKADQK